MSLAQALNAAVSGLHVSQGGLSIVAGNVANANTAGYIRKTVNQVSIAAGETSVSVRITGVQRVLDQYVQRQLRIENSGASYADMRAQFYQRLQGIYGQPGADTSLDAIFNNFTTALQALSASPEDANARSAVLNSAQLLTQQLNSMTASVQGLRLDAELGIADAVNQANDAMQQIAALNQQISSSNFSDATLATLQDQRDNYIDQLSQLMDITVVKDGNNQLAVFTNSGVQLVGVKASTLAFDAQGSMTASARWSADVTQRGVGTITLTSPNGGAIDLIQSNTIRSGRIAAYLQMRDQDLVQAQNQLDAIAAGLASALSDKTTAGTAVTVGAQNGFDIDIGALSAGNYFTVNYTDKLSNTKKTLTFVRVNDPAALPLADSATINPNDKVVGIDFSGGMVSVLAQVNAALAPTAMTASNPAGTVLKILDDGAGNRVGVNSITATATQTALAAGSAELPFFLDGGLPYTGMISAFGTQSVGFAGRINVNAGLLADSSKLVAYQAGIAVGDATRPNFIYNQLTKASLAFSPDSGIGTESAPYSSTLGNFLRQVISLQGEAANTANSLKQGQDVVLASLQQRFAESGNVNIDQEMTNLLNLQNSYSANARVLTAVKEMLDLLLRM